MINNYTARAPGRKMNDGGRRAIISTHTPVRYLGRSTRFFTRGPTSDRSIYRVPKSRRPNVPTTIDRSGARTATHLGNPLRYVTRAQWRNRCNRMTCYYAWQTTTAATVFACALSFLPSRVKFCFHNIF